ncbi:unnamed protein product [Vitrella brassicaformis CCMP3155]|uniref:BolA-like protein n=1 Tax=Vitrella brassicaformis (strain CCMP3155) TaxID=1169540 RepID=A0A0G4EGM1_VITBC|nr:unnamed protein product [Vitrella brassicaformis CCMP3155]|eukprot:CEL95392.1 unnamed protein product [Vitrella brassicaformis CCMP3155]
MATKGPIYEAIERKLTEKLTPTKLEIVDESHLHAGHAAMKGLDRKQETHFKVMVESAAFANVPMIKRHRLIYEILDDEIKAGVHALSISAKPPDPGT